MSHETRHEIVVAAAPEVVFDLIADTKRWPMRFPPNVHVERLEGDDREERIRIWATANDEVKTWTSRRFLDRPGLKVSFHQEEPHAPVAAMSGAWLLQPLDGGRTKVVFTHSFDAVGNGPDDVAWIRRAIDTNTGAELAALRDAAESTHGEQEFTFDDTVRCDGSPRDAYDFICAADRWEEELPHVARAAMTEEIPHVQVLEMDTRTADGSTHTTRSVRVCFPAERIVYKQMRTPALMAAHTGEWLFEEDGDGCRITSRHTVRIDPRAVPGVLGPQATVDDARRMVREALGRNSRTTLAHAASRARALRRSAPVPAALYTSVQQFYAEQMRLLDERQAGPWAETFTEDCVFAQSNGTAPVRGRAALAAAVRDGLRRPAAAGQQRRHVFGMLTVRPAADGTVRTRAYAQVLATAPGGPAAVHLSAVCEDVLVERDGRWLVHDRRIEHDGS
ncbi:MULTISPECIES: nuclear transport factor 2 family protein [Streptomyces]|uniref:SnoaL-like domain-containing protein n=1 Tax=Streptomyces luteosporeus TaxID=173856 RepID=A0ABP6GDR3_9ACTN